MSRDGGLDRQCQAWWLTLFQMGPLGSARGKADVPRPLRIFRLLLVVAVCSWCLKFTLFTLSALLWAGGSHQDRGTRALRDIQWPSEEALHKLTLHRVDLEETAVPDKPPVSREVLQGLEELDYTPTLEEKAEVVDIQSDPVLARELILGNRNRAQLMPRQIGGRSFTLSDIERRRLQRLKFNRQGLDIDDPNIMGLDSEHYKFLDVGFEENEESLRAQMTLKSKLLPASNTKSQVDEVKEKVLARTETPKESTTRKEQLQENIKEKVEKSDEKVIKCAVNYIGGQKAEWFSSPDLPRAMDCNQYSQSIQLISTVTKMFTDLKLEYVMAFGTLLGSAIGHDLIPWDDDLDLAIYRPHFLKLLDITHKKQEVLNSYNLAYTFTNKNQDKLFFKHKKFIPNTNWSWPFIDLLWYDKNDTHVWIHDPLEPHVRNVTVKLGNFYPIHKRPLANLLLNSPSDPVAMMNSTYGQSRNHMICTGTLQSHMANDDTGKPITVPCTKLKAYYPLVWRKGVKQGVRETVYLGNRTVYSYVVPEKFYKGFNPFLWQWQ